VWAEMSDPLGLSVGTTNLVAARVGNQPVTRRAMLTLAQSSDSISGFVERVGDRVPLVTPDGRSFLAEQLLVEALDVMVQVSGGPSPDIAIAVPAHWGPSTTWAFKTALQNSRNLSQAGVPVRVVSDAVAALTALQANPGITANGLVALIDFGGSGTSITLADAASSFEPIAETQRYPDFSGDLIDQALLSHVVSSLADSADPADTAAVGSLTRLREECRLAKERLSEDTATQMAVDLPGYRADVRITREELQELIRTPLDGVIAALDEMTQRNGTTASGLAALAIVGGGASIPFVAQRLSEHTRLPLVSTPQPALNSAVGAALFAAFGADAEAPTGAASAEADPDAPTGAAAAATDATAAAAVFDGPLPDEPGSATFRALAWSQEEGGDEPVPYTGENPYEIAETTVRPAVEYMPPTGPVFEERRRPWHRVVGLVIGAAAVIAIVTVGGVAYALTSASEDTKAEQNSSAEQPKPPEPEPQAPPKEESPKPPEPPPPPPEPPPEPPPPSPEPETVTEAPPPPPSPTPTPTTTEHTTTTRTTTTSPTTTTTSPTTTTTSPTTTTTTTTTSTTPSMTTSWVRVPFVPVPVPVQVPNQGPVQQAPQYQPPAYQPPVYPQSPWG
jgi:actin-like ATPase involved in cell morphogenesis